MNSLKYTHATDNMAVATVGPRPFLKCFLSCAAVSFIVGPAPDGGEFHAFIFDRSTGL